MRTPRRITAHALKLRLVPRCSNNYSDIRCYCSFYRSFEHFRESLHIILYRRT